MNLTWAKGFYSLDKPVRIIYSALNTTITKYIIMNALQYHKSSWQPPYSRPPTYSNMLSQQPPANKWQMCLQLQFTVDLPLPTTIQSRPARSVLSQRWCWSPWRSTSWDCQNIKHGKWNGIMLFIVSLRHVVTVQHDMTLTAIPQYDPAAIDSTVINRTRGGKRRNRWRMLPHLSQQHKWFHGCHVLLPTRRSF